MVLPAASTFPPPPLTSRAHGAAPRLCLRGVCRWSCSWSLLAVVLAAVVCAGCATPPPRPPPRLPPATPLPNVAPPKTIALTGPPGLPAGVVAELVDAEREVRFARNGSRGVLLTHSQGRWLTGAVTLDADGRAQLAAPDEGEEGAMHELAEAADQQMLVSLKPLGEGFVLAWASAVGNDSRIFVLTLDAAGKAVGEVQVITAASRQLRWVEVLAVDKGARLLWETAGPGGSDLFVQALPRPEGSNKAGPVSRDASPKHIASHVNGWYAAVHKDGVAVTWVSGPSGDHGTPYFTNISVSGEVGPPLAISDEASALLDIQTARIGDHHLVAWTDTRDDDPHIYLARIDLAGNRLGSARPAVAPVGAQGLVALMASQDGGGGLLAWEPVLGSGSGGSSPRPIRLVTLNDKGETGARAVLQLWAPQGTPQLVADGSGYAALTLAPIQLNGAEPLGTGPHYVRFDGQLNVTAAEPIRLAELLSHSVAVEGVPAAVRTLQCQGDLCTVVAVAAGQPALLAIASLPRRHSNWRAPAASRPRSSPPRARSLQSVAHSRAPLAALSAAHLDDGRTLVAYLSDVPAAPGEPAPPSAKLMYRFIAKSGRVGRERLLSERAVSIGGVKVLALHANRKINKRNPPVALIGWAAPTKADTQMFVTQLDKKGNKLKQRTVTKIRRKHIHPIPNEVADIDIATDRHGNVLCTWTDTRDGDPEVYLARLSPSLQKTKSDRRITHSAGPSLEPRLWVTPNEVYLAWSDSPEDGATAGGHNADIFLASFDSKTLKASGRPHNLSHSPAHARTPKWSGDGDGHAWLSWIQQAHPDSGAAALKLLALGQSTPRGLVLSGHTTINSVAVRCSTQLGCRGVVLSGAGGPLEVFGFQAPHQGEAAIAAKSLALLGGGSAQDLALTAVGREVGEVYFLQRRDDGQAVRRLRLDW